MGRFSPQIGKKMQKEYLYVGHYVDTNGKYVLKIGTTNDLQRRKTEHTRNYRRAKKHTLPPNSEFVYDWYIALSKYNTLRFEDSNRQAWANMNIGVFVRNDRFVCDEKPVSISVKIRKEYQIAL